MKYTARLILIDDKNERGLLLDIIARAISVQFFCKTSNEVVLLALIISLSNTFKEFGTTLSILYKKFSLDL